MMFRGVGTALITPFNEDGSLDEGALRQFVDWQIAEGVNFLVPCGTTGENPTLSADEHRRVVELTVQTANGRVPVLAGAGSNATPRAVELALQAIDLGADGILTITPYYNKPTPDGLRRHFGAQAEAVEQKKPGFPMIMYNVPGRTGLNMTAETTLRMAREIPNVIGVKEASGNLEQIMAILREREPDFLVLSGDDAWTLPLMAVGADGVISVASNEIPRLMRELVDNRDIAIHNRILPLMLGNFIESNPGPAKAALKMMGVLPSDVVRAPLAPLANASRERLRGILEECGLM
jgi:4-hydroxy-tetrahydrodipicolinate synthase